MYVGLITIGILIITYLFLAISRYFAKIFENIIVPFINKKSKGKIVTAEVYQNALERINFLEGKVEEERKLKNEAIGDRDAFEKRLYESNYVANPETIDNKNIDQLDIDGIVKHVDLTYGQEHVEKALMRVIKSDSFRNDEPGVINFFLKQGFVRIERTSGDYIYYSLTEEGQKFRKAYFKHNL